MSSHNRDGDEQPKYQTVSLSELRQGRLGKHHELIENILRHLQALPEGEAIKIPLNSLNGISKANLRSAIMRGTNSRAMQVATYSDGSNFYVWRKTRSTAQYERKKKKTPTVKR
jgi:hypothetical protein